MGARLPLRSPAIGALLGGLAVVMAQATRQWRDWGCAAPLPAPPCVRPAFWHWADVGPVTVAVGVVAGAVIAALLHIAARRERDRRHSSGEE